MPVGEARQLIRKYKKFCKSCVTEISYPKDATIAVLENWNRRLHCDNCLEKRAKRHTKESGRCASCLETKPTSDFPSGNKKSKRDEAYKYAYCKECHVDKQRSHRLFVLYRITSLEYDIILTHQGGVCAICKRPPTGNRLAVDHDHKTGLVRGLVCWTCNRALGLLRDRLASAQALVEYLLGNPATLALGGQRFGLIGKALHKKKMVYGSANGPIEPVKEKSKRKKSRVGF
jgi:hypothetical protein